MLADLFVAAVLLTGLSEAPAASHLSLSTAAIDVPKPTFMTGCEAEQTCPAPFSGTAFCTGNSTCSVGDIYVTCDNVWTYCSCSGMPASCNDPEGFCGCKAYGSNTTLYCMPNCTDPG